MSDSEYTAWLSLAQALAENASDITSSMAVGHVQLKHDESVVTEADLAIQRMITGQIRANYPAHAVIGEESPIGNGPAQAAAPACWVVDPLDGTRNYASGLPCYATSIGVLVDGRPVVGVIREHNTRVAFWAVRDRGVWMDGRPVKVGCQPLYGESLVATPSSKDSISRYVAGRWITRSGLVPRNFGSTAWHLALLASGALDAVFAYRCKIWDIAAGALIVREAGGIITDLAGAPLFPWRGHADPDANTPFLAGTPLLHPELQADLAGAPGLPA